MRPRVPDAEPAFRAHRASGDAILVLLVIVGAMCLAVAGQGPTPWLYDDRLRMGGIKLYDDGALGSRGAWLKADYADAPGQGEVVWRLGSRASDAATEVEQLFREILPDAYKPKAGGSRKRKTA